MTAQDKATPRPWRVWKVGPQEVRRPGIEAKGQTAVVFGTVADECGVRGDTRAEADANAALIVRAVNAHDELRSELKALVEAIRDHPVSRMGVPVDLAVRLDAARDVLARAEGERG